MKKVTRSWGNKLFTSWSPENVTAQSLADFVRDHKDNHFEEQPEATRITWLTEDHKKCCIEAGIDPVTLGHPAAPATGKGGKPEEGK